jgi:hypothetical protein
VPVFFLHAIPMPWRLRFGAKRNLLCFSDGAVYFIGGSLPAPALNGVNLLPGHKKTRR